MIWTRAISYAIVKSQVVDYYGMKFSMEDSFCALSIIVLSRKGHIYINFLITCILSDSERLNVNTQHV